MTTRLNPPPGWPAVPDGWTQPPGWQPDPTWPAPPAGWQLWVDETPTSPHRAMDSAWAIAGGTAVFLGSLLPFISFSDPEIGVNPGARAASALFGLIVLGLGIALRTVQRRFLMGASLATLCLSALGALGYAITILAGLAGVTEQDPLGFSVKITGLCVAQLQTDLRIVQDPNPSWAGNISYRVMKRPRKGRRMSDHSPQGEGADRPGKKGRNYLKARKGRPRAPGPRLLVPPPRPATRLGDLPMIKSRSTAAV